MYIVYTKNNCSFCQMAKQLLTDEVADYRNVEEDSLYMIELRTLYPAVRSMPQIFKNGRHIGGYTELVKELQSDKEEVQLGDMTL